MKAQISLIMLLSTGLMLGGTLVLAEEQLPAYARFAPTGSAEKATAGSVSFHRAAVVSGPQSRFTGSRAPASGDGETPQDQPSGND